jgi:hypothetical protein
MMTEWIFKDGATQTKCTSFPYAYRLMFNTLKQGVEKGRKYDDMIKGMLIISPQKDNHGDPRTYNYAAATDMAKASGLLTPDGQINSREFKRR